MGWGSVLSAWQCGRRPQVQHVSASQGLRGRATPSEGAQIDQEGTVENWVEQSWVTAKECLCDNQDHRCVCFDSCLWGSVRPDLAFGVDGNTCALVQDF